MTNFASLASAAQRLFLALSACLMLGATGQGQTVQGVPSPTQFDPSDVYFQGYLSTRSAEKLEAQGDHIGAAEKYRLADEYFSTIRKYYPDWRPSMVKRRSTKTRDALAAAEAKAKEILDEQRNVVAELEGGQRMGATLPSLETKPDILKVDPVASRRLKEAESEVERLRKLLEEQQDRLQPGNPRNGPDRVAQQLTQLQEKSARDLAAARAEIQRLKTEAAVRDQGELESEKLAQLLRVEQAKVKMLQEEAAKLRAQEKRLSIMENTMTKEELARAKAEIRRLKRESTMAEIQAQAEIERLRKRTGEMEADVRENIEKQRQLAQNAREHARQLGGQLDQLEGQERTKAEKEIQRLNQIADKAQAEADREKAGLQQRIAVQETEAEAELRRLRDYANRMGREADAKQLEYELNEVRQTARIRELEVVQEQSSAEKRQLEAKLKAAEADVNQLKARLAKVPMESEVGTLDLRIRQLEQERQAMALSLQQSQAGHQQARTRIKRLEKELLMANQKAVDLNRDLQVERDLAHEVVIGQRRQLESLQRQLDQKSKSLAAANKQISELQLELLQSREAYAELRDERDALMLERDQMAALLQLKKDGRIQQLIDQNMGLARKLRESDEAIERMKRNSDTDKDAITDALRDLAIAKSQINRLREEKLAHERRIHELQLRLQGEERALASGAASSDPQEVALLRDIIRRQLRMQTARRQARELLMNAVKRMGQQDPELSEAVALLETQEIALTPEEQKLIANRQVDGEFISPFAHDRGPRQNATEHLQRNIEVFDRAAKKAFISGRLHPTRELYEMILEEHPEHTPSLCKLGVVMVKLGDYYGAAERFRQASDLDHGNAYALRMLSYSLMKAESFEEAEAAARKAVKIDPNDAKTHMLLATLCFRLGKPGDAESHFKGAINADPMPSEPYYNLALIYSGSGHPEKALEYYRQALERGALPDPELEQTLAAQ
ncbi:MAG: tetratricopeptide repeat protein [Akkermansiaceae bacterium]|nr:tetratricopeptide repeat protein [Akkermansiaceae bacterium]